MKTIHLDDDVFTEIDKLATGIFSHSDVIRKLLKMTPSERVESVNSLKTSSGSVSKGGIVSLMQSPEYQLLRSGIDKYLTVLSWLHRNRRNEFDKVLEYRRGNRIYFAKSQRAVEQGGGGNIHAKQIPGSDYWVLATLDHKSKREILHDVLHLLGFQPAEINVVVGTIPDSGRHRSSLLDGFSLNVPSNS
jgi:negative regulator of replication initiation